MKEYLLWCFYLLQLKHSYLILYVISWLNKQIFSFIHEYDICDFTGTEFDVHSGRNLSCPLSVLTWMVFFLLSGLWGVRSVNISRLPDRGLSVCLSMSPRLQDFTNLMNKDYNELIYIGRSHYPVLGLSTGQWGQNVMRL